MKEGRREREETRIAERLSFRWRALDESLLIEAVPPKLLMLELTNACNLKCVMCRNPAMVRRKGMMAPEIIEKTVSQAAEMGIEDVALFTTGESLLHKGLLDAIRTVRNAGLSCYLTSNGLLLNPPLAEALCLSGLASFKFSIDGATREEYEAIRVNGSFEKLIENVRLLRTVRDRTGSKMRIICAAVVMRRNEAHLADFRDLFEPMCDEILFSFLGNLGGRIEEEKSSFFQKKAAIRPCRLLWDRIVVNYDGTVTACCIDFDAELVYGDIRKDPLVRIWNNAVIREWRRRHLAGNLQGIPLCDGCDHPALADPEELLRLQEASRKGREETERKEITGGAAGITEGK
ncbi:MAG: radical SAM protein [Candidatus Hydrogenedentota bacterium]|nr:MAG: radical SAM protein [Candidatus Hydrogenedentota bacterium]